MSRSLPPALREWLLPAALLAYLWFTLLNHLRIEWTVNPQYSYGWIVPFFCLYLVYLRGQSLKHGTPQTRTRHPRARVAYWTDLHFLPGTGAAVILGAAAAAWLPLRLVQEANPEWRLVSWIMALAVVGLTLMMIHLVSNHASAVTRQPPSGDIAKGAAAETSLPRPRVSMFVFPLLFFLVAVPWPTLVEAPLIHTLTQANARWAIELINLLGVTAVQHGNLIEIQSGMLGLDDACSGIRSFQATLMISLFLGELYRLSFLRRLGLCLFGFAFSFVFNVGRTTLLTLVAARFGIPATDRWHDPAGYSILVLCLGSLWLLALWIRPARHPAQPPGSPPAIPSEDSQVVPRHRARLRATPLAAGLLVWFLLCEVSVAAWYRLHEAGLLHAPRWTVACPTNNPSYRELGISDVTRQYLRHDSALNAEWTDPAGRRWQVIFLRWEPGQTAVHLARGHTPHACLPASGRQIVSTTELRVTGPDNLSLPFRHYVVKDAGISLHVFYCLWEDRGTEQHLRPMTLTWRNRLEPVLSGRRNLGQRSLEVAVWGIEDESEAETVFGQALPGLIQLTQ